MNKTLVVSLLALAAVACGKKDEQPAESAAPAATAQAAPSFTPFKIDSIAPIQAAPGVKIYMVQKGTGQVPKPGQEVVAHYHGMLPDGKVFDSSFLRGQPFPFPLGQGRVIRGWDIAFAQLPVGSKAVLELAPEVAYGEMGSPPDIGPNATLLFHVEVLGCNGNAQ